MSTKLSADGDFSDFVSRSTRIISFYPPSSGDETETKIQLSNIIRTEIAKEGMFSPLNDSDFVWDISNNTVKVTLTGSSGNALGCKVKGITPWSSICDFSNFNLEKTRDITYIPGMDSERTASWINNRLERHTGQTSDYTVDDQILTAIIPNSPLCNGGEITSNEINFVSGRESRTFGISQRPIGLTISNSDAFRNTLASRVINTSNVRDMYNWALTNVNDNNNNITLTMTSKFEYQYLVDATRIPWNYSSCEGETRRAEFNVFLPYVLLQVKNGNKYLDSGENNGEADLNYSSGQRWTIDERRNIKSDDAKFLSVVNNKIVFTTDVPTNTPVISFSDWNQELEILGIQGKFRLLSLHGIKDFNNPNGLTTDSYRDLLLKKINSTPSTNNYIATTNATRKGNESIITASFSSQECSNFGSITWSDASVNTDNKLVRSIVIPDTYTKTLSQDLINTIGTIASKVDNGINNAYLFDFSSTQRLLLQTSKKQNPLFSFLRNNTFTVDNSNRISKTFTDSDSKLLDYNITNEQITQIILKNMGYYGRVKLEGANIEGFGYRSILQKAARVKSWSDVRKWLNIENNLNYAKSLSQTTDSPQTGSAQDTYSYFTETRMLTRLPTANTAKTDFITGASIVLGIARDVLGSWTVEQFSSIFGTSATIDITQTKAIQSSLDYSIGAEIITCSVWISPVSLDSRRATIGPWVSYSDSACIQL